MNRVAKINTEHEDLIHDICYDYYGKRLATCSSDHRLKVWDLVNERTGKWESNDSWRAHDSSVLKVKWSHPEFGQILASCSFDKTVKIWEEQEFEPKNSQRRWAERAFLTESRGAVQDIEFAPHHLGLRLAACGSDGVVRMYEAMEVTNLSLWSQVEDFDVTSVSTANGTSTGINSTTTSMSGTSGLLSAKDQDGTYCLSWSPNKFLAPMIAVGCGKEMTAKIFTLDSTSNRWVYVDSLPGHGNMVHDISWAPSMGRTYELIATACKDQHVRIFKLTEKEAKPDEEEVQATSRIPRFDVECIADFPHHENEVWRVEWNVTGTILSSSGDDGRVRLWKTNYANEWRCMSTISAVQNEGKS